MLLIEIKQQDLLPNGINISDSIAFYPKELTISETTESTSVASYLDLLFTRDRSNNITTKLYDKRDAFGFHIVNFPFMSSNIPSAPAYGVYASQLIRYARCCSSYSDFLIRHRALVKRLLSQGYKVNRLSNTFNPILPGLLNTLQTWGGAYFTPPPNSLVFYPRSIKFGM